MHVRQALPGDAAAACEVLRRSITELCSADHHNDEKFLADWLANKTVKNVEAWIADPANFVCVAEENGKTAGVAAMTTSGRILLNYVSPDFRFRGISKMLLQRLEQQAVALDLAQCRLESTKTAEVFYRAAGFRDDNALPGKCGTSPCRAMIKDIGGAKAR